MSDRIACPDATDGGSGARPVGPSARRARSRRDDKFVRGAGNSSDPVRCRVAGWCGVQHEDRHMPFVHRPRRLVGSIATATLYEQSRIALVAFAVMAQLVSLPLFVWVTRAHRKSR
jgi:hypothetical protein